MHLIFIIIEKNLFYANIFGYMTLKFVYSMK